MHRRKPRLQMSINSRPLALGREVNEKGCGCFPGTERLQFPTTVAAAAATTSPQTPKLWRGEKMWRLPTSLRKAAQPQNASVFAPRAFRGCFIAGGFGHKCHTNLDRSHLMSEEAAAVHNRRLFAHCCRRASPRVWGLQQCGPCCPQESVGVWVSPPPHPTESTTQRA